MKLNKKIMSYYDLTDTQRQELSGLNERLRKLQSPYIKEVVKIYKELAQRVLDSEDLLYDYEIELKLTFYLREDDPDYKDDDDNILTEIEEYLKKASKSDPLENYPWKEDINHNDFPKTNPMSHEHHCWWYHSLYDHRHMTFKNMLRIGTIWCDIIVQYQYKDNETIQLEV